MSRPEFSKNKIKEVNRMKSQTNYEVPRGNFGSVSNNSIGHSLTS